MTSLRRTTSKRDLAVLFLKQDGKCKCGVKLEAGNYNIDHNIALVFGGTDTLGNKVLLCIPCHRIKTFGSLATSAGSDLHMAAKVRRLNKKKSERKKKYKWAKQKFGS